MGLMRFNGIQAIGVSDSPSINMRDYQLPTSLESVNPLPPSLNPPPLTGYAFNQVALWPRVQKYAAKGISLE